MTGTIVFEGGGPFVANDDLDRRILASHERVVVMPTADAFEQPQDLVDAAHTWSERIGVTVEPLMVLTRREADDEAAAVIDGATAVMLVGDSAIHLRSVLKGTPVFAAIGRVLERDGVVIGVGPSAAALCDPMPDRRGGAFALGLGLVPGMAVLTEAERWSPSLLERAHDLVDVPEVDLPTGSALVRTADGWELVGEPDVRGELPA